MERKIRSLTLEETDDVVREFKAGATLAELSESYKVDPATVYRTLAREGVDLNPGASGRTPVYLTSEAERRRTRKWFRRAAREKRARRAAEFEEAGPSENLSAALRQAVGMGE